MTDTWTATVPDAATHAREPGDGPTLAECEAGRGRGWGGRVTRCYSWAEFYERYDETEADHRCDLCGGWVATCGCPPEADEPRATDMDLIHGAVRLINEHRETP